MSAQTKKPPKRRALAMHRIMKRISKALGPFTPNEILMFNPEKGLEGFSTFELSPDEDRKTRIKQRDEGFFESLYRELPAGIQRRFLLLDIGKSTPTPRQYRALEHKILGYARHKLMRELVARINTLPRANELPRPRGRNGGTLTQFDRDERLRIQAQVKELMQSGGEDGEPISKRKACETVAQRRGISARHVWRILGH